MREFLKMSALSAVLSMPAVAVYNQAWSSPSPAPSAKIYQDRLPASGTMAPHLVSLGAPAPAATGFEKGDRLGTDRDCAAETWPYIAPDCLASAHDTAQAKRVRVITMETRVGPKTSVLSRVPPTDLASR